MITKNLRIVIPEDRPALQMKRSHFAKLTLMMVPVIFLLIAVFSDAVAVPIAKSESKKELHYFRFSLSPFEPGTTISSESLKKAQRHLVVGDEKYLINPVKSSVGVSEAKIKECLRYQIQNWIALSADPRVTEKLTGKITFLGIEFSERQVIGGHSVKIDELDDKQKIVVSKIEQQ